jgi:hypothetical protein
LSVMPGLEEMVTDLSWVEFSAASDLCCDVSDCDFEAVVRTFWETPPACEHEIRNYCVDHRDKTLHDHEEILKGVTHNRWICGVCQDKTGNDLQVWFLGMEPIR